MNVRNLGRHYDIVQLREEVMRLIERVPLHPIDNQVCLNHRPGAVDPFMDGAGSSFNFAKDAFHARDRFQRV